MNDTLPHLLLSIATDPAPAWPVPPRGQPGRGWLDARDVLADHLAHDLGDEARSRQVRLESVREFNDGGVSFWYVAPHPWTDDLAWLSRHTERHLTPDRADRQLRRRVLALFPGVVVLHRRHAESLAYVDSQDHMNAIIRRANARLRAEGWRTPPEIFATVDEDGKQAVWEQTLMAPDLILPEPQPEGRDETLTFCAGCNNVLVPPDRSLCQRCQAEHDRDAARRLPVPQPIRLPCDECGRHIGPRTQRNRNQRARRKKSR